MIDTNGNYVVDVPALTAREDGHTVTATISQAGNISYSVDDGDGKREIGEELAWDSLVCAHMVTQLRLVQQARKALEALYDSHIDTIRPCITNNPYMKADSRLAKSSADYIRAMAALPHTLL